MIEYKKLLEIIYNTDFIYSNTDGCNILRVNIPFKEYGDVEIIGCRMETGFGNKTLKDQYDYERECFDNILIPVIKPTKSDLKYIVCGDFNNAKCRGDLNKKFISYDYINSEYNTYFAQYNYNLNIIKDEFEKLGFEMVDKTINGEPVLTCKKTTIDGKIFLYPDDHIFVNGFNSTNNYAVEISMSDHKMLIGELV